MVAGPTVGVERTSVWLLSPDRQDIFCLKQYNFSTGSYTDFVPAREPPAGGYRALLAESGRRGLDICRREKDRIKVIILDVTMPDMSGPEVFECCAAISPISRSSSRAATTVTT